MENAHQSMTLQKPNTTTKAEKFQDLLFEAQDDLFCKYSDRQIDTHDESVDGAVNVISGDSQAIIIPEPLPTKHQPFPEGQGRFLVRASDWRYVQNLLFTPQFDASRFLCTQNDGWQGWMPPELLPNEFDEIEGICAVEGFLPMEALSIGRFDWRRMGMTKMGPRGMYNPENLRLEW